MQPQPTAEQDRAVPLARAESIDKAYQDRQTYLKQNRTLYTIIQSPPNEEEDPNKDSREQKEDPKND